MDVKKESLPLVVIFGRTNVGKSTLFNRLTEKPQALVSQIEGTTRDANIGTVSWIGVDFKLIDTGGIMDISHLISDKEPTSDIDIKVQRQARTFLKRADLILFLVDNKNGLLPGDREMAMFLKKSGLRKNRIILVANKVDTFKQRPKASEFHRLALGDPEPVSAANGTGTGDLLDIVVKKLKRAGIAKATLSEAPVSDKISVCILGKPNVGKSSLLNAILGEERVIVSHIPHTTREPQDTFITYKDKQIRLIDTAGISRKGMQRPRTKKDDTLEKHGIAKSLGILRHADIALLVLDINKKITHQDAKLVEEIFNRKKSLIIIANKWDLIKDKNTKTMSQYIYSRLPFATWAPIHFTSALTGAKVKKLLGLILEVAVARQKELSRSSLNTLLKRIVRIHKPAKGKGYKHPRIYAITQTRVNPPEFTLRIGRNDDLHFSYVRFIENRLREKHGYIGTPITTKVQKGKT